MLVAIFEPCVPAAVQSYLAVQQLLGQGDLAFYR